MMKSSLSFSPFSYFFQSSLGTWHWTSSNFLVASISKESREEISSLSIDMFPPGPILPEPGDTEYLHQDSVSMPITVT